MAPQLWKVVGGKFTGGIIVREGQSIKSKELGQRLSTGAVLEELDFKGQASRLHFNLVTGTGPSQGWVSLQLKDNVLVQRTEKTLADLELATAASEGPLNEGKAPVESAFAALAPSVVDVTEPVCLMFPGQGSQYVKMMSAVQDLPAVKEMLEQAHQILGYDLLELCLEGPEEKLEKTCFCQPALFVAGLAGAEKLRAERPGAAQNPRFVAGLSLGEYTALCVAGVFTFEEGLRLVKLRGEAMQEAAEVSEQLMLSVAGLDGDRLRSLCEEARQKAGAGTTCQIANELFPKGYACAGSAETVKILEVLVKDAGALQAKILKTSGAFHTPLMSSAQARLNAALDEALPKMRPPTCSVVMNVTAEIVPCGADPKAIVENLKKQLTQAVLWEKSVNRMVGEGVTEYYEVGPMKQLKAMMKRINLDVWKTTNSVEV